MMHAAVHSGWRSSFSVIIAAGWYKTLIFIVVAPLMGMTLGLLFMTSAYWLLRHKAPQQVDSWFRKLQLLSAACYSLGHGGNDAQKTMGIIAGAIYTGGFMSKQDMLGNWGQFHWPIILAAHAAIAAGTYFGGWRIVSNSLRAMVRGATSMAVAAMMRVTARRTSNRPGHSEPRPRLQYPDTRFGLNCCGKPKFRQFFKEGDFFNSQPITLRTVWL